jgi:hypothetical protein
MFEVPSVHVQWEDNCAVWLHSSVIFGLAALGVTLDAKVGLCFCALYHSSP